MNKDTPSLNPSLKKVIKVLKQRNILGHTNNQELARLSGLSTKTISRSKEQIEVYTLIAPAPSQAEELSIDKKIIDNYIDVALNNTEKKSKYYYSNIMGAIAGYVLRQETDLLNHVNQPMKVINIGVAFMNLASQIRSKKDSSKGRPIHSKSKHVKYLIDATNKLAFMDKLFIRSDNYKAGAFSKSWSLSEKANEVVENVIKKTINWMESLSNVPVSSPHIRGYICGGKSGTSPNNPPQCFTMTTTDLRSMSLTSILHILNNSEPSGTPATINVSLENLSSTNEALGRNYNVFTRLKSSERTSLGYINYDISGGIQVISFGILRKFSSDPTIFEKYNMIFNYATDPKYKKDLRSEISTALNIPVSDVKSLLTAYANGSSKNSDKHDKLKQFAEESDLLRRDVTSITKQYNPQILEDAIKQSKHEFPQDLDWMAVEKEDPNVSRDKASVYFFIWTRYEKQIRDAMLSLVNDGIPVHDAIYSKQNLSCAIFEKAVLDQTGFELSISH